MNIKEAKQQIKNAMVAYFSKDENGDYIMPIEKQRPVFLMGAPGIGKTAIMEQVASEMGVGLLSYSMTHHTRQSALGLPFIVHKNYDGMEYEVSEYTMSEIISAIYDLMENTGVREGILFLDEINCVSETLAPIMLQFLQYKVFGRHRVPKGWIVVTAGNPPEYNNSVREFDIVTWDRLKRVDIEPDFRVWKEYAIASGVHPAVLTYLDIKSADFYRVESTVEGKTFVTARGWEDLSQMIRLYERNNLQVDRNLTAQYLQDKRIARDFAQYYDLFNKYRSDYQVDRILDGRNSEEIVQRARLAKFDERLSLIGLLIDAVNGATGEIMRENRVMTDLMALLRDLRMNMVRTKATPSDCMNTLIAEKREQLNKAKEASSMSLRDQRVLRRVIAVLDEMAAKIMDISVPADAFAEIKKDYDGRVKALKKDATAAGKKLENMFGFAENAFGNGQELLIIATELTASPDSAGYISRFGCEAYFRHNKDLLLYERGAEIAEALKEIDLFLE